MSMKRKAFVRLDSLNAGEGFLAKFYASDDDGVADEPCLTIRGEYLCPSEDFPNMCVVRIDGVCVGYEPADLQVEKIEE